MSCFIHGMEIFFMLQLSQKDLLVFFRRNGEGVLLVTDKIGEMDFLMVCRTEGSLWSLVFIRAAASLKLNKVIRRASSALRWVSTWDKRCIECSRWWATLLALWAAHRWKRSWVSPVVFRRRKPALYVLFVRVISVGPNVTENATSLTDGDRLVTPLWPTCDPGDRFQRLV